VANRRGAITGRLLEDDTAIVVIEKTKRHWPGPTIT